MTDSFASTILPSDIELESIAEVEFKFRRSQSRRFSPLSYRFMIFRH